MSPNGQIAKPSRSNVQLLYSREVEEFLYTYPAIQELKVFGISHEKYGDLKKLRAVTQECGVLLMFDEVVTGFCSPYGGAQEKFGVVPDLAAFGKPWVGACPLVPSEY